MSGRGRGKKMDQRKVGPVTRQMTKNLAGDFETPSNYNDAEEENPSQTGANGSDFREEVEQFISETIEDETERARRGLLLLQKSPTASQTDTTNTTQKKSENATNVVNRNEIDKMISDKMKVQTEILTERFSTMMVKCFEQFKNDIEESNAQPIAPVLPPRNQRFEQSSSDRNNTFPNLFTRPDFHGAPNDPHHSLISNRSNFIKKEDFAEIKFDGKASVRQFLFKLRTLKEANDVSWEYITKNFYRCVKDSADIWYWGLAQKVEEKGMTLTWDVLKSALENDFGSRQTDADLSNMMWNRKQKHNESFHDFFDEIWKMNGYLSKRKDDEEIINMLKSNCSNRLGLGLFNITTKTAQEFKMRGVRYEEEVEKRSKYSNVYQPQKKISEISNTWEFPNKNDNPTSSVEREPFIESINYNKEKPKIKCNNCQQPVIFCYRCFTPDVIFTNCPTCQGTENSKLSGSTLPSGPHSS